LARGGLSIGAHEPGAEEEVVDGDVAAEQGTREALPRLQRQGPDPLPAPLLPDEDQRPRASISQTFSTVGSAH
jgi:hypothetical protein